MEKENKRYFGNVKKCALYVRYSINNEKKILEQQQELKEFCKEKLKTENYEEFIEVGSVLKNREVFDEMMKKMESGEISHLIVKDTDRIYKGSYDINKKNKLINKIKDMNVTIISLNEEEKI